MENSVNPIRVLQKRPRVCFHCWFCLTCPDYRMNTLFHFLKKKRIIPSAPIHGLCLNKYSMSINPSFLWDIGKPCKTSSDAAKRGSGSLLFAYRNFFYKLNSNEKYHLKIGNGRVQLIRMGNTLGINELTDGINNIGHYIHSKRY